MNTKLFTGLALAAALLIGGPAYAHDNHKGGKVAARTVAVVHHGGGHVVAAVHRGGAIRVASRSTAIRSRTVASRRTFTAPVTRGYARNTSSRSTPSVAFGGSANNSHGRYAFASHAGWSHDRDYTWDGHHYRWYNNGWFIIDPFPYYGYGSYGPGYYGGGSVGTEVQAALYQQGYYQGPIDGIVGPGTQAAIAAYQRDNGLRVTGTITPGLLSDLGVG